jgi:hypothetical protein
MYGFEPTEDQRTLRETVRRFATRERAAGHAPRWTDALD